MAGQDAAVAEATRLQNKQKLGQQALQLVDGPALDCCAFIASLDQAPPHCFQAPYGTHTMVLRTSLSGDEALHTSGYAGNCSGHWQDYDGHHYHYSS